jgi:hypothetical protein
VTGRAVAVALLAPAVALGALWAARPAQAAFAAVTSASSVVYTSATLQPPATVSATCTASGSTSTATVTWTASPTAAAGTASGGYRVTSTPTSTTVNVTGSVRSTTLGGLTKNSTYTFSVLTTYRSWTSAVRTTATVAC